MPRLTLLDIARTSGGDVMTGLIEELMDVHPEFAALPAMSKEGTSYQASVRVGRPTVGFRRVNEGVTPTKSKYEARTVQMFPLSARVEIDQAVYLARNAGGRIDLEVSETRGVGIEAFAAVGRQVIYGQNAVLADKLGFPGFEQMVDSAFTISAGGTTNNTASSVYFICARDPEDVSLLVGNGGQMTLTPFRDETCYDANGKAFPGRVSDLICWIGLQCVKTQCIVRVCNLTEDSGKGFTDKSTSTVLEALPAGYTPTHCFVSRRSRRQLQDSRSVTIMSTSSGSSGDASNTAPLPTETLGIPLVVTDSIVNTEKLVP